MSPANPKFPSRARLFPGIVSGCTIDWFLPWPQDALVAVSRGFIGEFKVECTPQEKEQLMIHMGEVHNMAVACCSEYFTKMRRNVYQTPKSFLSFLADFKAMYSIKLAELKKKADNVALGLDKLEQGAKDVAAMKIVLADQQVKLKAATIETNKMLASLEISSAEAMKESKLVQGILRISVSQIARALVAKKPNVWLTSPKLSRMWTKLIQQLILLSQVTLGRLRC